MANLPPRSVVAIWRRLSPWRQETAKPPEQSISEDKPAREQTIYIPYAKLRQIFEKEGRGVFVPTTSFSGCGRRPATRRKKIEDYKPPVAALIAEIESEATVSRDVMTVIGEAADRSAGRRLARSAICG